MFLTDMALIMLGVECLRSQLASRFQITTDMYVFTAHSILYVVVVVVKGEGGTPGS